MKESQNQLIIINIKDHRMNSGTFKPVSAKLVINGHELEMSDIIAAEFLKEVYGAVLPESEKIFIELAAAESSRVRSIVADLADITQSVFDILINDPQPFVRRTLIKNFMVMKYLTDGHVQSIIDANDVELLEAITHHFGELTISKKLKTSFKKFVLNSPDPELRSACLSMDKLTPAELSRLQNDPNLGVRNQYQMIHGEE